MITKDEAFRLLDLKAEVSSKEIQQAYLKMAFKYHPDRFSSMSRKVWATRRFIAIKEAHDLLISFQILSGNKSHQYQQHDSYGYQESDFNYHSHSLFSKLINKIPDENTIKGFIIGYLIIFPLSIGFIPYAITVHICREILQKFKIKVEDGKLSYMLINTLAATVYFPIFLWMVFMGSGSTSPTLIRKIIGIILSSGVIIFLIIEWISYFIFKKESHLVYPELKKLFTSFDK